MPLWVALCVVWHYHAGIWLGCSAQWERGVASEFHLSTVVQLRCPQRKHCSSYHCLRLLATPSHKFHQIYQLLVFSLGQILNVYVFTRNIFHLDTKQNIWCITEPHSFLLLVNPHCGHNTTDIVGDVGPLKRHIKQAVLFKDLPNIDGSSPSRLIFYANLVWQML